MKNRVITLNSKSDKNVLKANSLDSRVNDMNRASDLVIEDNTIYEIDQDCINCMKKENVKN